MNMNYFEYLIEFNYVEHLLFMDKNNVNVTHISKNATLADIEFLDKCCSISSGNSGTRIIKFLIHIYA